MARHTESQFRDVGDLGLRGLGVVSWGSELLGFRVLGFWDLVFFFLGGGV